LSHTLHDVSQWVTSSFAKTKVLDKVRRRTSHLAGKWRFILRCSTICRVVLYC